MKGSTRKVFVVSIVCICLIVFAITFAYAFQRSRDSFVTKDSEENAIIAVTMDSIIKKFNITSICDIACGNCEWVPLLLEKMPTLKYTGYEQNNLLIEHARNAVSKFKNATVQQADPMTVTPETSDLVLSRGFLETLSYDEIRQAMVNFSQMDCKFLAFGSISHRSAKNENIQPGNGSFMLNLEIHPFNMSPAHMAHEGNSNRQLFVYTIGQIRGFVKGNAFWTSGLV